MSMQWIRRILAEKLSFIDSRHRIKTDFGSIQDDNQSTAEPQVGLVDTLAQNVQTSLEHAKAARLKREFLDYKQCASRLDDAFYRWLLNSHSVDLAPPMKEDSPAVVLADAILNENRHSTQTLPRCPASLPILIRLMRDEEINFDEICKTLLSDPSLTDKILRTANSPIFRRSQDPISTIEQAVLNLGLTGIQRVVSTVIMEPMIKSKDRYEKAFSDRVWMWAQLSALGCDLYGHTEERDHGALYLCGLLPALSLLQIYRQLTEHELFFDALEHDNQGTMLFIYQQSVKHHAWPLCREIREQWGLPEYLDQILEAKQLKGQINCYNPLKAAMSLASFQVLNAQQEAPLSESDMSMLCQTPESTNQRILESMKTLYDQQKAA